MTRVLLVIFVVLIARSARAASGGEDGHTFELIWHALNLALLLGVIVYFGRGPIQAFFATRRTEIREGLESSARVLEEAEARLAEWQGRLERLDGEIEEIRATTTRLAEAERERILADAQTSAERVRRDAVAAVEQEIRRARTELRTEASDLAVELAERLLRDAVNDGDQERLVAEFVERIERASAGR